jgi:hypothetical protein
MNPTSLINLFLTFANQLKFKNLFLLILCLFVIDLIVPDMIPMIDEIILGLLAILLAGWKKGNEQEKQGTLIEGEIVGEDDK